MGVSESQYLLTLWSLNVCPMCGKAIPEGTRVGSGRKSEGGFCSLDCYTIYYGLEIQERAQRAAQTAEKRTES
jgi:predicted nucleic acid-binding Zn ribbon protein